MEDKTGKGKRPRSPTDEEEGDVKRPKADNQLQSEPHPSNPPITSSSSTFEPSSSANNSIFSWNSLLIDVLKNNNSTEKDFEAITTQDTKVNLSNWAGYTKDNKISNLRGAFRAIFYKPWMIEQERKDFLNSCIGALDAAVDTLKVEGALKDLSDNINKQGVLSWFADCRDVEEQRMALRSRYISILGDNPTIDNDFIEKGLQLIDAALKKQEPLARQFLNKLNQQTNPQSWREIKTDFDKKEFLRAQFSEEERSLPSEVQSFLLNRGIYHMDTKYKSEDDASRDSSTISSSSSTDSARNIEDINSLMDVLGILYPEVDDPLRSLPQNKIIDEMSKFHPSERGNNRFTSFLGREEFVEEVIQFTSGHLKRYNQNLADSTTKQTFSFGSLLGGSGLGKTRASCEIVNIINKNQNRILQEVEKESKGNMGPLHCFTVRFFMEHENRLRSFEETLIARDERSGAVMGLRLFCHFFMGNSVSSLRKLLGTHLAEAYKKGIFDLGNVMDCVSKRLHHYTEGLPGTIVLLLIADEYQKLKESIPNDERRLWKRPLHGIGGYANNARGPNENLSKHELCLIPIVAGTLVEDDMAFAVTDYTTKEFTLRPFQYSHIERLLHESLDQAMLQRVFIGGVREQAFQCLWYEFGMIPRSLEYAIQSVQQFQNRSVKECQQEPAFYDEVREAMSTFLSGGLYTTHKVAKNMGRFLCDFMFGGITVTNFPIVGDILTRIDQYRRQGILYIARHSKLYLQTLYFRSLLASVPAYSHYLKLLKDDYQLTGEDFEEIDLYALSRRIRIYSMIDTKLVSISKHLFPGAMVIGIDPGDVILPNIDESDNYDVIVERQAYIAKKNEKVIITNETLDDIHAERVRQSVPGHKLTDGRVILRRPRTISERKVMIVIQYKLYKDSKNLSPSEWLVEVAPILEKRYPQMDLVYVYITSAKLSKNDVTNLKYAAGEIVGSESNVTTRNARPRRQRSVLLVHLGEEIVAKYFAPNLLPYIRAASMRTKTDTRYTDSQEYALSEMGENNEGEDDDDEDDGDDVDEWNL